MSVIQKPLTSFAGFKSPGFTVTEEGVLSVNQIATGSIAASSIAISGINVVAESSTLPSIFVNSSLETLGTLNGLTVDGISDLDSIRISDTTIATTQSNSNLILSPNGSGIVEIGSSTGLEVTGSLTLDPTTTGSIDNVVIGETTAQQGTFTNVVVENAPTLVTHATRKDYVDTTAIAFAVALGS